MKDRRCRTLHHKPPHPDKEWRAEKGEAQKDFPISNSPSARRRFLCVGPLPALFLPTTEGEDGIIEGILVEDPDFSVPDDITKQIESGTLKFIADVEDFLGRIPA